MLIAYIISAITLILEAVNTSEMSDIFYDNTPCNIPEDSRLENYNILLMYGLFNNVLSNSVYIATSDRLISE
jgi:hypothetical protein